MLCNFCVCVCVCLCSLVGWFRKTWFYFGTYVLIVTIETIQSHRFNHLDLMSTRIFKRLESRSSIALHWSNFLRFTLLWIKIEKTTATAALRTISNNIVQPWSPTDTHGESKSRRQTTTAALRQHRPTLKSLTNTHGQDAPYCRPPSPSASRSERKRSKRQADFAVLVTCTHYKLKPKCKLNFWKSKKYFLDDQTIKLLHFQLPDYSSSG